MKRSRLAASSSIVGMPGIGTYEWLAAEDRVIWSDELMAMYGVREAPQDESAFMALVHPADRLRVEGETSAFLQTGDSYEHEFRIIRPNGEVRLFHDRAVIERDAAGRAVRVRGINIDVTAARAGSDEAGAARRALTELIERSPFGVYTVDPDLRIVIASTGAGRSAGRQDLQGLALRDVLTATWCERFADEVIERIRRTLETGESCYGATTLPCGRDRGSVRGYDWRTVRVTMPDGRHGVACYFYDQSEHLAREAELRENEARLKLAYQAADMGAWDLDLAEDKAVWTPEMYALLGLDPSTPASSKIFFDAVHPDDLPDVISLFDEAISRRTIFQAEFRILRPDGSVRHVAGRGRIVSEPDSSRPRMIGVNFDVTERRLAERAVHDSELRLRRLIDNMGAFIGLLDPDGRLKECNRVALERGGLDRSDVVGKMVWDTYWWSHDPALALHLRETIARVREGETVVKDAEVRIAGDKRINMLCMFSPVHSETGEIVEIVGSGVDITERKKAEEHVRLLMRELNHRSKNIYALVQAVARQTGAAGPGDFLPRFQARIQSLSDAHDLLLGGSDAPVPLDRLVRPAGAFRGTGRAADLPQRAGGRDRLRRGAGAGHGASRTGDQLGQIRCTVHGDRARGPVLDPDRGQLSHHLDRDRRAADRGAAAARLRLRGAGPALRNHAGRHGDHGVRPRRPALADGMRA